MTRILFYTLLFTTFCLTILQSCRTEDEYFKNKNESEKENYKFEIFSKQNQNGIINYADGFKYLMERYDSIHNVVNTVKTLKISFHNSKTVSSEYIEFNIRSQEFTTNNHEKYVLFPLIRNYNVDDIIVASLKENETIVEYYVMAKYEENYEEILNLFKEKYLKASLNRSVNKSGCGFEGDPPCDIETVIIKVPGKGNGNGLPSGGSGGTKGGCSMYQNCIRNDPGGGGGDKGNDQQTPCEAAVLPARKATTVSKSVIFKSTLEEIKKYNDNIEHGVVFGKVNGKIVSTKIQDGTSNNLSLQNSFSEPIATLHSHSGNHPPSSGDVYDLIKSNLSNESQNTSYVVTSEGVSYALIITNSKDAEDFLKKYPPKQTQPNMSPNFPGQMFIDLDDITFDGSASMQMGLAYVLDKYNTGVALTKMDSNGNFFKLNPVKNIDDGKYYQSNCN